MDPLQLEYRSQQYWFDASDREARFLTRAVEHAAARHARQAGPLLSLEEVIAALQRGEIVQYGTDWDNQIRARSAVGARLAAQPAPTPVPLVQCDCGHLIAAASVMNASRGSACPDCYDRLSD